MELPITTRRDLLASLVTCFVRQDEFVTESNQDYLDEKGQLVKVTTPFYEHYHELTLPMSALINPVEGYIATTTPVDQDSYDKKAFDAFIASVSHGDQAKVQDNVQTFVAHKHQVTFTKDQLSALASGQAITVGVISPNKNLVHSFRIQAPRAIVVKVQLALGNNPFNTAVEGLSEAP